MTEPKISKDLPKFDMILMDYPRLRPETVKTYDLHREAINWAQLDLLNFRKKLDNIIPGLEASEILKIQLWTNISSV